MCNAVQALPSCITNAFDVKQMKERSRMTMQAAAKYEAKHKKLQDLRKPGPYAVEVLRRCVPVPLSSRCKFTHVQVASCVLEADDEDEGKAAAAGVVVKMLKEYSDFFDVMQAAAVITQDVLMQPFVAWFVSPFWDLILFCFCGVCDTEACEGTTRLRLHGQQPRAAASRRC